MALDSDDSVETDALYQGYGTHYVDLWVGTPPQRQTVIVDTGSSVTAFPCMDCVNCGDTYHTDAYFQQDSSSTFQDVSCQDCWLGQCMSSSSSSSVAACELSVSYQEGSSWRALEVMDLVHAGGPHSSNNDDNDEAIETNNHHTTFPFRFGCQTHLTGLFKTQLADGIMGMEMAESSFWKQMHTAHPDLVPQSFSLCFGHAAMATKEGSPAGLLHMGGTNPHLLHNTTMVYAHQPNHKGWFAVQIQAIYLRTGGGGGLSVLVDDTTTTTTDDNDDDNDDDDNKVHYHKIEASVSQLNNGQVIVDSGTTDTYLSSKMSGAFEKAWKQVTGRTFTNNAFTLSEEGLKALPTIVFQLKGAVDNESLLQDPYAALVGGRQQQQGVVVDAKNPHDILVAMPSSHYMEYSMQHDVFKIRIYLNELHGGVLGANFMLGHDILFDVENNRLGFAESDCDYDRVMNDLQQESPSDGSL